MVQTWTKFCWFFLSGYGKQITWNLVWKTLPNMYILIEITCAFLEVVLLHHARAQTKLPNTSCTTRLFRTITNIIPKPVVQDRTTLSILCTQDYWWKVCAMMIYICLTNQHSFHEHQCLDAAVNEFMFPCVCVRVRVRTCSSSSSTVPLTSLAHALHANKCNKKAISQSSLVRFWLRALDKYSEAFARLFREGHDA
jgi:hypothetical protein